MARPDDVDPPPPPVGLYVGYVYVCTIIGVPFVYDLLGFCSFIGVSDEKGGTSHRHGLDFPVYITLSLLFPLFVPYLERSKCSGAARTWGHTM